MTAPGRRPSSNPPDPVTTCSTAAVSVTMEKITSAARATSAADCSSTIPLATSSFVLPGVRFQPCSSCPASKRRAAIRLPMEPRPTNPRVGLADGVDNLGREAVEAAQELTALAVQALDLALVLVQAPLRLVEPARAQDGLVLGVDPGNVPGDLVAEVGILFPLDRALRDPLDDRGRVLDPHLPRALVRHGPADTPRVHEEDLERVLGEQLEEAVALEVVRHGEERVRAGDPQELALLRGTAGGRARRLPE